MTSFLVSIIAITQGADHASNTGQRQDLLPAPLSQAGLSNVLADPTLELHDGNGSLLISNDNWMDDPISAAQLTASGLAPQAPTESAIFTSLSPGAYTAILAGKNGSIGIGLVEIYSLR